MSKKVYLIAVHKKTDDFQSATLKQYVITLPFSLVRMLSACLCSLLCTYGLELRLLHSEAQYCRSTVGT